MEKGRKEYGHGLVQNSGYVWLKEALEEALDLSIYLSAKLIEISEKENELLTASPLPVPELCSDSESS